MSIEKVAGTDLAYCLVSYDKNGRERSDDPDGLMSEVVCRKIAQDDVTDVFIISHGWKGDIPAAREQYGNWIGAMAACAGDREAIRQLRPNFKSLIVGFHWPSQPWGDEEIGMAAAASFAAPAGTPGVDSIDQLIEHYVDLYADRIADSDKARAAIRTIVKAAASGTPVGSKLPPDVEQAYRDLDAESGMGGNGPTAAPGDDREPFDPNKAYANAKPGPGEAVSFAGGGLSGILSPLRQLSFWQMKNRARTLGESAGFKLLSSAQAAVPAGRHVRFHLMGHSFGCIVMSGFLNGPDGGGTLKPVHSLTLVQGATSLWGYCDANPPITKDPGYFRGVIAKGKVAGAIVTTQSKRDTAVGRFYPIAAGVARQVNFPAGPNSFPKYGGIGAFGLQGPGLQLQDLEIKDAAHAYGFQRGHVYNLECTSVIKDGEGASGAHSDIAKPEVAHAMWEAVKVPEAAAATERPGR